MKTEAKISAADNHEQHNHDSEACTPFCTCTCCAASAFYPTFSKTLITTIAFKSEEYPLYNVTFDTEAHKSIWQPPKA